MCLQDEETDGHRAVCLLQALVRALEELRQRDEVAEALAHLLPVDGNHVVVDPVMHHVVALACHRLCNLTLVMREYQVHAASVDVEMAAQILAAHRRAFAVPARETVAPRARPAHDMLRLRFLPQCEVSLVVLLAHAGKLTRVVDDVVEVAARQPAILIFLVVFLDVEINGAVALVCETVGEDFLHQLYLLDDMPCGMRLDARREHVERCHGVVVAVRVVLRHLHRLELLHTRFLRDFILSLVGIMFQMPHVGDVPDIAHLITEVLEITENDVERDGRTCMPQMGVAIHRRSAHIHPHKRGVQRFKQLFRTCQRVINQ